MQLILLISFHVTCCHHEINSYDTIQKKTKDRVSELRTNKEKIIPSTSFKYILSKENTIDGESAVIISFLQINEEEIILEFRSLENQRTDPTNLPVWS